jgi:transcriptional regulator GlxA family with amidase domain
MNMAHPHQQKLVQLQGQTAHFKAQLDKALALLNNPLSSPAAIDEATQTVLDMEANLQRLFDKYGVQPASPAPEVAPVPEEPKPTEI